MKIKKLALERLEARRDALDKIRQRSKMRHQIGEFVVLVLAALTSLALWALVTKSIPDTALWIGAIASSLITLISVLLVIWGYPDLRVDALILRYDISRYMTIVRNQQLDQEECSEQFQALENRFHPSHN